MSRIDFIPRRRADTSHGRDLRAFLTSCAFHGLALGSLVGLGFMYQSHLPPTKSGSAPGAPTLCMETMVIVSPPPVPAPPAPAVSTPAPAPISTVPPRAPQTERRLPEQGVPVWAVQPSKPAQTILSPAAKSRAAIHPAISPAAAATAQSSLPKPAAAASVSSYAPGPNVLPHPPYPTEARDRGQTGTVIMNVQFDVKGDVADATVAQSSGVPLLDAETRSFIRARWHSPAYAGRTVSVPVQYKLENL
jgi:protein TonB